MRIAIIAVGVAAASVALAGQPAPTPAVLTTGKTVYTSTCAACHGENGDGKGPVAFAIKPPPRNFRSDPFKAGDSVEQIFKTITNGLPDTRMVGYPQIPEEQRWALAYYVRAFRAAK